MAASQPWRGSIYLAGPEVFLRDAKEIANRKREICHQHDLEGLFPLDTSLDLAGLDPAEQGLRIFDANKKLMDAADCIIANMTPFRGPSMDVGTAFEIGYMAGRKRPVLGYTNVVDDYVDRVGAFTRLETRPGGEGLEDPEHMLVEDFRMADNLMLEGAVRRSEARVVRVKVLQEALYTDLRGFEECVRLASKRIRPR